ncbi:hypothetical protein CPB84DRAFT_1856194 [Gymnopilus junonius]|uniref:Uncharacterized protein n=1 Tax=Gymnopilus junonius TaxID=109634 RepID=A0A9P5N6V5_GYMJU|nr:hypothetical protein CPB84DRAFT_1856194 [Gymnopilus junonius]
MDKRIAQNPHLEAMPDHAGPHYDVLQAVLTQNGMLEEGAIQALNTSWIHQHNEQIQRWDQQAIDDDDAAEAQQQQQEEEHLTKVDDMVTLKSVSSLKASRNVIPDADLSFQQMSMAKNALIPLMAKYEWTERAVNVFAQFFTLLEMHPHWLHEYGERALLVYQA